MKKSNYTFYGIGAAMVGVFVFFGTVHAVTVPVQPRTITVPVVELALTPVSATVNTGDSLTLKAVVQNKGNGIAEDVQVNITVPDGVKIAESPSGGTAWAVGALEVGASTTQTFTVSIANNAKQGARTISARVSATAVTPVTASTTIEIKKGKVLGATVDELPNTGTQPWGVLLGIIFIATGIGGIVQRRRFQQA